MTADEIRKQFNLSKQAITNYLSLGVLNAVPGTENDKTPLYYTDEVAVIREAMTSCESSIKRLNTIHKKVNDEIFKANTTLSMLKLDAATKDGATKSIIDSIALFMNKALPNLNKCSIPLFWLTWSEGMSVEQLIEAMTDRLSFHTPQDFCNELYHEVEAIDATSLNNIIEERGMLEKENEELKARISQLESKISMLVDTPESKQRLTDLGHTQELTQKQVAGLQLSIFDCGFSVRVCNSLKVINENGGIVTLADVVQYSPSDLLKFRNFGKNSLAEIQEKLAQYDLKFNMDVVEIEGKYFCHQYSSFYR